MSQIVPRSGRQNVIDLTSVYSYDTLALLIPVFNDISSNTQAVIKPFQWPVKIKMNSSFEFRTKFSKPTF